MQQLSLSEFPLIISWVNLKIKKKKSVRKREQKFVKLCGPQRSLVEQGGSGHVWLFFNDPVPGGNQAAQQDVFDCRVRGAVKRFPLYNKILLPINPSSLLMILLFIFQAPPLLKKKKHNSWLLFLYYLLTLAIDVFSLEVKNRIKCHYI